MPLYEYRCSTCGPFEARADVSDAGLGAACPRCGAVAERRFATPGSRGPRRRRQLDGLSGPALRRVDRTEAGAASIGGLPAGVRLDGGGRSLPPRPDAGDRRPWQLGH